MDQIDQNRGNTIAHAKGEDREYHERGSDRLIADIKKIGETQARIAKLPLTHCDFIMAQFLQRMHDLFEARCSANYTASGAELRGVLKLDQTAYRITIEPVREKE